MSQESALNIVYVTAFKSLVLSVWPLALAGNELSSALLLD